MALPEERPPAAGAPVNPLQHIDLRVRDREEARRFYSRLLPELGLTREESSTDWTCFYLPEGKDSPPVWFGFTEDREHTPCGTRIAFHASGPAEVDRLAAIALEAGAQAMSGPRECPEYSDTYYAAFFDDPSGNPLEICSVGS